MGTLHYTAGTLLQYYTIPVSLHTQTNGTIQEYYYQGFLPPPPTPLISSDPSSLQTPPLSPLKISIILDNQISFAMAIFFARLSYGRWGGDCYFSGNMSEKLSMEMFQVKRELIPVMRAIPLRLT